MGLVHSRETVDTIRRMWDAGMTAAAIGAEMGLTKNAVIGIAYRNDFKMRTAPPIAYSQAVITPIGKFPSIRAASRAYRVPHSTGQRWAAEGLSGWKSVDR